ncbi:preprotein translocase subunit YajC [Bradyrhizobium sp. LB7.2]
MSKIGTSMLTMLLMMIILVLIMMIIISLPASGQRATWT